ncbi:MAG: 3-hydroxyacyl-CoA dehydrogenase NAD-binding domain-containing protein, partial [Myxococcota bacterium]
MSGIRTLGLVGAGIIGAGWATRALARGLDVVAWDPGPHAEGQLRESVQHAWPAVEELGLFPGAALDRLRVVGHMEEVAESADFVQESAPERIEIKRELIARIDATVASDIPIASSTSGLLPTEFQADCQYPERVLVGHPFNPVYLLPLVEVLGGSRTDEGILDRASAFYSDLGMHPLRVRREVPGFLSDRLQEAMWREILHLVNEGVATPEELDAAISYGPGLRWAIWGTCLHFHLAGGSG